MIVFDGIPSGRRVPGSMVEFSNVRALQGLPPAPQKILLIGQRTAAGTIAQLVPKRLTSADMAAGFFGRGSQLHGMAVASLAANSVTETWAIALDDNAGGTAATWTVTITGPATGTGSLALLINGTKVSVAVQSGDSATTIAAAVVAAVNALLDLIVTAANAAGVVTLTCRHKGTLGNDIDIRANYYDGDLTPAGVTVAIAAAVAGATNPDLSTVWAAIGDEQYQTIALGLNDATNLTLADTELVSRWGPLRQIEGRAFASIRNTLSGLLSFGASRNGIHTSVIGGKLPPTPPWKIAAAFAAVYAFNISIDPARPLTNLVVPGVLPPAIGDRFIANERDQLLNSGISTFVTLPSGEVAIERLISCYRVDAYGIADPSWLDVTTTATLAYYRYTLRARISQKFPRVKLTSGQIAAIRAEIIALARDWEAAGLMESIDTFIANLVVEKDASNATQLNVLATPDLANPMLQFAARIEFYL